MSEHKSSRPATSRKRHAGSQRPRQVPKPNSQYRKKKASSGASRPNGRSDGKPDWKPPCPHAPHCYGCPFVSIPYDQQLERKQTIVQEAFAAFPSLRAINIPLPVASPKKFGYRSRVKLAVQGVKGQVRTGLYVPETHQVFDISACPVHPKEVNRIVAFLKQAIERLHIIPYDEARDTGQLRYIDLRYSFWQRKALLLLVTRHMHFPQVHDLTRQLERRFPFLSGIVHNINDQPGNVIWGKRFRPLRGRDSLLEQIGHVRLSIPVDTFSQVNPPMAKRIYETAVRWSNMTGQEIVLDVYCGIGPIALYCASQTKFVAGIEENERAVNVAKENARRNGYHNTRFFHGDAAQKIEEVATTLPPIDRIVLNPPRTGLSPEAFSSVIGVNAPKLLYISCSPRTLARDLDRFTDAGYTVGRVQPFDMFPQTDQIETLALIEKGGQSSA